VDFLLVLIDLFLVEVLRANIGSKSAICCNGGWLTRNFI